MPFPAPIGSHKITLLPSHFSRPILSRNSSGTFSFSVAVNSLILHPLPDFSSLNFPSPDGLVPPASSVGFSCIDSCRYFMMVSRLSAAKSGICRHTCAHVGLKKTAVLAGSVNNVVCEAR
ncbi:hypothetical protein AA313_de0209989 [Arthrobotrys entomopaga]|nr:hypothetical protein AA313_de0209989 [Arthrobotrys entomopaga]